MIQALADVVSQADRDTLARWTRAGTTPVRVVFRSRIVHTALNARSVAEAAAVLDTRPATVRLWIDRVLTRGIATVWHDAPGRGRKPTLPSDVVSAILAVRDLARPTPSVRSVALRFGVSPTSVWRIWMRPPVNPR